VLARAGPRRRPSLHGAVAGCFGATTAKNGRRLRCVAAPAPTSEVLVRDELRGPVSDLVRRVVVELVREQLNGAASVATEAPQNTNGATKTCRTCGIEKPADQFAANRRVCKSCRREQNHVWEAERVERRREQRTHASGAAPDDDEGGPRADTEPQTVSSEA
jgi:hypothetical protein